MYLFWRLHFIICMPYVAILSWKVLFELNMYSSQPKPLVRPNNSAVTRLMQDATLMKNDFPRKTKTPQIMVPRSKLSLISAVYLL